MNSVWRVSLAASVFLSTVCSAFAKPAKEVCAYKPPNRPLNPGLVVWNNPLDKSCLGRINYYRWKACHEGWDECPDGGLPPMTECPCCNPCANSESNYDQKNGAHASFGRCGEGSQGQGEGDTCGDVIDMFISERKKDESTGKMVCTGHCGPVLREGCNTFHWGVSDDKKFWTLNWKGECNIDKCMGYCDDNKDECTLSKKIGSLFTEAKCQLFHKTLPHGAGESSAAALAAPSQMYHNRPFVKLIAMGSFIMAVLVVAFSFVKNTQGLSKEKSGSITQEYGSTTV